MAYSSDHILEIEIPTDETSLEHLLDSLASLDFSRISSGTIGGSLVRIPEKCDTVVIGSGFSGTAISLALADKYRRNGTERRISILERGQWWIKPQSYNTSSSKKPDDSKFNNVQEFLGKRNVPYNTLKYKTDPMEIFRIIGNSTAVNRIKGLYDLRILRTVQISEILHSA